MNILITGIAGFVGSSLTEKLLEFNNHKIIGVDNFSYGEMRKLKNVKNKISLIRKDIINLTEKDFKKFKSIDIVIHLAAIAPLPDNQINPSHSITNNVSGTANILEISRILGVKKFIFMSSGSVYEGTKIRKNGYSESNEINTSLMYPTTKYLCEKICKNYQKSYGMPIKIIRLFNLYGPNQDYKRKHPPLLSLLIKGLILNQKVKIFNLNPKIKRDYIFIDDLIVLIQKFIDQDFKKSPDIVNACSGESLSVPEIIKIIETVSSKRLKIEKSKSASLFWSKYPKLFYGKYPLQKKMISNEVFKSAEGNTRLLQNIISKKPVKFKDGIKSCIDLAKEILKK